MALQNTGTVRVSQNGASTKSYLLPFILVTSLFFL